jgi:type 1 glutamine amidotransferase
MRVLRIVAALVAMAVVMAGAAAAQAKLNCLIVTGQNNHDWRATTPVLKDILERSGRFTVTVNEHPEACTAADFAPYDVILSNYNGKRWGATAEQAFLDFVRSGKGFVVIHAADNAFTDWPEYVALIGGIWAGAAGHGQQHEFLVRIVDHSHPITRGMSDFMHATDELYHRLEMQPNIHLLATAFDAPETDGTGRDEPIAWTVDYQGGRCFHNVLGHSAESMQDAGFVTLVQRGTEWAATGTVSDETDVRMLLPQLGAEDEDARYAAKARLIGIGRDAIAPLMEALTGDNARIAGEARDTLIWIAQRWAGTPQAPNIEETVTAFAASGHPVAARALAVRMLGLLGDAGATPALKAALAEQPLREEARRALMQIPGPEATQALVQMLGAVGPDFASDVLHALAARGDRSATPAIIAAAQSGNIGVRVSAVAALGQMGDATAAKPLWDLVANGPGELRSPALDAYLRLADSMLAEGQVYRGFTMFRQGLAARGSKMQTVAALVGLGRAMRPESVGDMAPFLSDTSPLVQTAAAAGLAEIPGAEATRALVAGLAGAAPALRARMLGFLGRRRDPTATSAIVGVLSDPDPNVRLTAVVALGAIGDPSGAPAVRKVMDSAADPLRAAALNAYLDIADAQVRANDRAGAARAYLYAVTVAQGPDAKARALRGLGSAGDVSALPAVKAALDAPEASVSAAAAQAYIALGDAVAAGGNKQQAAEIYNDALKRVTGPPALAVAGKLRALGVEVDFASVQGFVTNWWIMGPFPNANKEAWGKHYFPEQEIALDKEYTLDGQKLAWHFYHTTDNEGIVALDQILKPSDYKAAYMYAQVTSPDARKVKFKVGSDDAIKVWLNRQPVFANNVERGVIVDNDVFGADLKQGANDILVEVLNGSSDWGAVMRITDEQDRPLLLKQRTP